MLRTRHPLPALILGCTLVLFIAPPAAGAPCDSERARSPLTAVWQALSCFWHGLAGHGSEAAGQDGPLPFAAADESDGGPDWDPDGLTAPTSPGDRGPDWDRNGSTWQLVGGGGHQEMDTNGATEPPEEADGHPEMDPDG